MFGHRGGCVLESERVGLEGGRGLGACQERLKLERIDRVWFGRCGV